MIKKWQKKQRKDYEGAKFSVCVFIYLTLHTLQMILYTPDFSLYIPYGTDKENFINNQELLKLVIISFILMTLMFDSRVKS